jgi:threonine dehydratase
MAIEMLDEIRQARTAMQKDRPQEDGGTRPPILHTPCVRAPWLEALVLKAWEREDRGGLEVRLKLETQQETASFKQRGAFNKLRCLREAYPDSPIHVFTASAGNHAQGVARHARDFDIQATIVMPTGTPRVKVENTRRLLEGTTGEVVLFGNDYDAARKCADEQFAQAEDAAERMNPRPAVAMVHAFNDRAVIAGQGTVGLELLEDWPDVDVVVAGVGGGGLISGIAAAIKPQNASVAIIGVESASQPAAYLARKRGGEEAVDIDAYGLRRQSIADGIAVAEVGSETLPFLRDSRCVDALLTVQEDEIAHAIAIVLRKGKLVIEGACATTVAALLNPANRTLFEGKRVVLVLSGGNLDPVRLAEIIHWHEFSQFVAENRMEPDEAWEKAQARATA